jgi:hypothetical protein
VKNIVESVEVGRIVVIGQPISDENSVALLENKILAPNRSLINLHPQKLGSCSSRSSPSSNGGGKSAPARSLVNVAMTSGIERPRKLSFRIAHLNPQRLRDGRSLAG